MSNVSLLPANPNYSKPSNSHELKELIYSNHRDVLSGILYLEYSIICKSNSLESRLHRFKFQLYNLGQDSCLNFLTCNMKIILTSYGC